MGTRIERQIEFLAEVDKMKSIYRQSMLIDKSKYENDAEHSWHFALMAMILYEYVDSTKVDICRVLKIALIHDLVEIYAGDTPAYDVAGNLSKEKREREAADKLFAMLPQEQGDEIRGLWEEFEEMETADSKYANAIDVLQSFLQQYHTKGTAAWKKYDTTSGQVYKRMEKAKNGIPELWEFIDGKIKDAIEKGYLKE
jgi:putative hydrolase of HD superfamily